MRYLRRTYQLAAELEEILAAALWEQGTLGWESLEREGRIVAYFDVGAAPVAFQAPGVTLVEEALVDSQDWLARYRELAQPLELGQRLVVDPREEGEEPPVVAPGRTLLHLPARTAFGTGSHASTQLALAALESLPLTGWRVLDVGAGSGILSFAACRFGAAWAVGLDIDAAAVMVAKGNAQRNGIESTALFAGTVDALAPSWGFDAALVNVLPDRILADAPRVVSLLRPGGALVVSGMLATEAEAALGAWVAAGALLRRRLDEQEWAAALLERVPA